LLPRFVVVQPLVKVSYGDGLSPAPPGRARGGWWLVVPVLS
jgi:hypothetical protein